MQWLKQLSDGSRKSVSESQWCIDQFDPDYMPIIQAGSIIVYRLNGVDTSKPERTYRYGGRNRGGRDRAWNGC